MEMVKGVIRYLSCSESKENSRYKGEIKIWGNWEGMEEGCEWRGSNLSVWGEGRGVGQGNTQTINDTLRLSDRQQLISRITSERTEL